MDAPPTRPRTDLTLTERVQAHIDSLGHTVPGEKARPNWAPAAPGPLRQLLIDVLTHIDELEDALCDMTEERDMHVARNNDLEQGGAA
jgi:hypothetical protein